MIRRPRMSKPKPDADTLVGLVQIARHLECSQAEALYAIQRGGLPTYKRRGIVHASRSVIRDWIARAERAARIGQ